MPDQDLPPEDHSEELYEGHESADAPARQRPALSAADLPPEEQMRQPPDEPEPELIATGE